MTDEVEIIDKTESSGTLSEVASDAFPIEEENIKKSFSQRIADKLSFDPWLGLKPGHWDVHAVRTLTREESFVSETGFKLDHSTWRGLQGRWGGFFDTFNPPVFIPASLLLIIFLVVFSVWPQLGDGFVPARDALATSMGWLYLLVANILIILLGFLGASKFGDIRLGDEDGRPEFSALSWVSMLFSAGLGIGLVFYGAYEPMSHYNNPPYDYGETDEEKFAKAVPITLFNWCFHAWGCYSLLGLSISYFSFRLKLPASIRSTLYPLLGKYTLRWPGHCVDILAMFGTIFGLATSLGIGALQINAGLSYIWPSIPTNLAAQAIIISCTTLLAILSLISGIGKGMKLISNFAMFIMTFMMLFVFCVNDKEKGFSGSTQQMLDFQVQNIGGYIDVLFERSFIMGASNNAEKAWMNGWTLYYIGWFFSWCPFVATFLANISKNRTIREYIFCTMIVPYIISSLWFTVFGVFGINALKDDPTLMDYSAEEVIYRVFDHYASTGIMTQGASSFLSVITIVVLVVFFVSSSDSGSFVVDSLGSGGNPHPPIWQKLFWAIAEGATALILLYSGGADALSSLQAMVIILALPISILLLLVCVCLVKTLYRDPYITSMPAPVGLAPPVYKGEINIDTVNEGYTSTRHQGNFNNRTHILTDHIQPQR